MNAINDYYYAKEREESAVQRINDSYLEALNSLEKLEAENAKLRELVDAWMGCGTRYHTMSGACPMFDANAKDCCKAEEIARELGVEVGDA